MMLLVAAAFAGPTVVDLWRGWPGSDKVFVEVGLPDGSTGLFLVDTGATLSVMNEDTAERLGIVPTLGDGELRGLSGTVPWRRAVLTGARIGDRAIPAFDIAVGVAGAPEETGPLPVDGILGNNVWANYVLVVDYPADRLEIHDPGTYRIRGRGAPLFPDENHLYTPVLLEARQGREKVRHLTTLEIDTGAATLSLWCQTGEPFRELTTLGVEPVFGIGVALDRVPDFSFLVPTRRVPLGSVETGGRTVKLRGSTRWSSPDAWSDACAVTPGLIGHEVLGAWRAVFDYPGARFALEKPRKRRIFDALGAWLERDAAHAEDPAHAATRARVVAARGELPSALNLVEKALQVRTDDVELHVLRARLLRHEGRREAALEVLRPLDAAALAQEEEWVAFVNTLILAGKVDEALQRAQAAAAPAPEDPVAREEIFLALSDAALAAHEPSRADAALDEAIAVDQGGSAFLLRRARIAALAGDRHRAIATLRQLLNAYPLGGQAMWLYGLVASPEDEGTLLADLDKAIARLHPDMRPLDFVGAAAMAIGETERAHAALAEGRARDCAPLRRGVERDNCEAWYLALGLEDLDGAQARIDRALKAEPRNTAWLDTAGVVARARGEVDVALKYATDAAWLDPWDPYLLWQRERLLAAKEGR